MSPLLASVVAACAVIVVAMLVHAVRVQRELDAASCRLYRERLDQFRADIAAEERARR